MADIIARCPTCGNTDVRERNEAFALLRVTRWERDEQGNLAISEIGSDEGADWETAMHGDPLMCLECEWSGYPEDLIASDREPANESRSSLSEEA